IRGIQTRGGAAGVGASTTSAVVSAIVMIVIANGLFAILYYILGI
ncbi:MAG: ABC transporter permease, partial [Planctomycetota bacterium]|nr:ABC transporter permease [Planctomycetota bacterium]